MTQPASSSVWSAPAAALPVLRGRPLLLARAAWTALAGLSLVLLIVTVASRSAAALAPRATPNHGQAMRPGGAGAVDLAAVLYGGTIMGAEILAALGFFLIAGLIFWRRSNNAVALMVSLMLAAFGAALPGTIQALVTSQPIWAVPGSGIQALGWFLLLVFGYVFPDGRFVPRWTLALAVLGAAWVAGFFLFAPVLTRGRPLVVALAFLIWVGWLGSGALAQLYRYRFVATPAQRQQTKWIVWGFSLALVGAGAAVVPHILALAGISSVVLALGRTPAGAPYQLIAAVGVCLAALLIPVTIAIAVLRHHLYDIDLLINRTLVYGALTVLLAAVYFGVVIVLQIATATILGTGSSTLAIVASTLLIAALFTPLRRRLQIGIDRRFYRRKYNAARALEAFSATLRHEVDLARLCDDLVRVVDRTMRPEHISLWLRQRPPDSPPSDEVR